MCQPYRRPAPPGGEPTAPAPRGPGVRGGARSALSQVCHSFCDVAASFSAFSSASFGQLAVDCVLSFRLQTPFILRTAPTFPAPDPRDCLTWTDGRPPRRPGPPRASPALPVIRIKRNARSLLFTPFSALTAWVSLGRPGLHGTLP